MVGLNNKASIPSCENFFTNSPIIPFVEKYVNQNLADQGFSFVGFCGELDLVPSDGKDYSNSSSLKMEKGNGNDYPLIMYNGKERQLTFRIPIGGFVIGKNSYGVYSVIRQSESEEGLEGFLSLYEVCPSGRLGETYVPFEIRSFCEKNGYGYQVIQRGNSSIIKINLSVE